MTLFAARILSLASILVALSGCAHRLSGPIHGIDGPAWIAAGAESQIAPIEVVHRLILIGDAGLFLEDDPTLAALDEWATSVESSTALFLGDNIYSEGLTDDDRERGEKILGQQLAATAVRKIFIPGNHDWGLLPKNYDAKAIQNQQSFVDGWPAGNAEFIPKAGCMGPTTRVLRGREGDSKAIVLIALDPTLWIQDGIRTVCPSATTHAAHLAELDAALQKYRNDFVLVASHYPMLTGGPHGGLTYGFPAQMFIGPLGWLMGGLMNTYESGYADWIEQTQEILRRNPPEIYAGGHDHSLQILESGDVAGLYIVSGAGARDRVSTVTNLPETIFAHAAEGFVVVDFGTRNGQDASVVRIIEPITHGEEPVFEMDLP
ncbi:MAG: hypothetical protein GY910_09180 [bacterium]|nr:hypothetical protein [bacterium]